MRPYSASTGSFTFTIISARVQTSLAVETICAPARTYSSSGTPEPMPAPFSTSTVWPREVSVCTPPGTRPTRHSRVLISLGTPMSIAGAPNAVCVEGPRTITACPDRSRPIDAMAPRLLFADEQGRVFEHPLLRALALTPSGPAPAIDPPVVLPPHATLSVLPGRRPLGLDPETGQIVEVRSVRIGSRTVRPTAVGAILPPGWTRLALPAYRKLSIAPILPQWAYTMAAWDDEAGHVVWALRTDRRSHWDPASHSTNDLSARVETAIAARAPVRAERPDD